VMNNSVPPAVSFSAFSKKKVAEKPVGSCKNLETLKAMMENPEILSFLQHHLPEKYAVIKEMIDKTKM
ncbi:hypothetical protein PMAYCL1PPCAC_12308, partial [Pristionchus mayeri]